MHALPNEVGIEALVQVVEQSPLSIVITNINGDIQYVNPAFSRIYGYDKEEVLGKNPRILKSGAHTQLFYKNMWNVLSGGEVWKGEIYNKKKDGSMFWESATISPVYDKEHKLKYFVASKEDISDKKQAQEELIRGEAQFQNLAELAPVIISLIDSDGNFIYENEYCRKKWGKHHKNILDVFMPMARERLQKEIDFVFANFELTNFQLKTKVGKSKKRSFLFRISPNRISGVVDSAIVIAQDISELVSAKSIAQHHEEQVQLLAENVADVVWVIDRNKRFTFVTPSVYDVLRYRPKEFLKLNVEEFLPSESVGVYGEMIEKLFGAGDPDIVEFIESELKKKNGDTIWIDTRAKVFLDSKGQVAGVVGVSRDISERRESENKLLKSEKKFRTFFENSNAIILVVDPEKKSIVDANKAAMDFYGYSREEFASLDIQKQMVGLYEASKVEAIEAFHDLKNIYAQRHFLKNEKQIDVEIFPGRVEVDGVPLVYTMVQDVSQRKKAIEALKESEGKKLALLKIIPDLIVVFNKNTQFVDVYTDDLNRLMVSPHKLLGKYAYQIFPEAFCEKLNRAMRMAFEEREIQKFEHRYKKTGRRYVVEEISVIVSGEDEVLAIVRDITDHKNTELELTRAWKEAEEADRVKSSFLANMSHEIRTPINAIVGFGELLQSEVTEPMQEKFVESILSSSRSLLDLINDLLDLSKIEAGKMSVSMNRVDIRNLLMEIENVFAFKAREKSLGIIIDVDKDFPRFILSDEMRLRQIFMNLVGNALKFTHKGQVSIYAKSFNERNVEGGRFVDIKFEVEDTGIGISDKNIKHIFDAFRQQDDQDTRMYGGTGLGLTITKSLVELLDGSIQVNSKEGEGSRFSVIFFYVELDKADAKSLENGATLFSDSANNPVEGAQSAEELSIPVKNEAMRKVLEEYLNPFFKKVTKTSSFTDYSIFANLLKEKGGEFGLNQLTSLGKSLEDASHSFDLERINVLMAEFKCIKEEAFNKYD